MTGKNSHRGWLKDPKKPRQNEAIGGGYFVFRRGDGTKRIRPSQWPFEYASLDEANDQARKLTEANPGYRFDVVSVIASYETDEFGSARMLMNTGMIVERAA